MELLEAIQIGIETGESEFGMAEVIIWFIGICIVMTVFFIWEHFVKLTDSE